MKSVFLKKQGATPKNKVLDFLIVYQEFDYSLKEIARYSGVGYPTIKILIKKLLKDRWVIPTRKVGKAQMYKLNLKSKKVQKFVDFFWAVVSEVVEKELGIKDKEESKEDFKSHSSMRGLAVSARNA